MSRGRIDVVITLALLGVLLAAASTGVLAEYVGVERSVVHRAFGYSLVVLGCTHAVFRQRQLMARLFRRSRSPSALRRDEEPARTGRSTVVLSSRRSFLLGSTSAAVGWLARPLLPFSSRQSVADEDDLGQLYHDWSKPSFAGALKKPLSWGSQPPLYRDYPQAPLLDLPAATVPGGLTVEEAIQVRRSRRDYSGNPMALDQLAHLLHAAAGVTQVEPPLRASPSAGAQYPLELYVVAHNVSDLSAGVYHYRPADHALEFLKEGDLRVATFVASGLQDMAGTACAVLVITAVFQRTRWRYHERTYRYVLLEAGHLGQNIYLQGASLGLAVCGMGAFLDDDLNALIGVDGEDEAAVYVLAVGSVT